MPFPYTPIPWFNQLFVDDEGAPVPNGTLTSKVTGTNTDKDTYSTALGTPNDNPITLDGTGRPEPSGTIFIGPGGYDFTLKDEDGATLRTMINVEDVGQTFLSTLGQTLAEGEDDAPDGYVITDEDNTVSGLPVAGGDYYLPPVADRGLPLTFINKGAVSAFLAPVGSDTINGAAGLLEIPAGTSPTFAGVTLYPHLPSDWRTSAVWGV